MNTNPTLPSALGNLRPVPVFLRRTLVARRHPATTETARGRGMGNLPSPAVPRRIKVALALRQRTLVALLDRVMITDAQAAMSTSPIPRFVWATSPAVHVYQQSTHAAYHNPATGVDAQAPLTTKATMHAAAATI